MPRKTSTASNYVTAELLLRSINLAYDADVPERIGHFRPTSKCVSLLQALLGHENDRAFMVVAPYGTGKSLTATYLLQLVENRPEASAVLGRIAKRLAAVSPELGRFASNRRRKDTRKGLVLALHGHSTSVPAALKRASLDAMQRLRLGRQARPLKSMPVKTIEQAIDVLRALNEKVRSVGCDRIVIVWDEFGRHLESLIAEGRGEALGEVQLLAEFVSRSQDLPMTLGLLMHQGLMHYAGGVAQTVRNDWLKIEGRFKTIQYVDDSKEIYRLITDVAAERHDVKRPTKKAAAAAAKICQRLGLFSTFNQAELSELLRTAAPIDPVTLYLLPRVSARVAQNERTLFGFLYATDVEGRITPGHLYDFFAPAMRSDTSVGGTHRQWLETESAITKTAGDEQAAVVLKTACLLGLGTSGERSRTSRELLSFGVRGFETNESWERCIDHLVDRKLLLHRRHNDEISVWHGTDLDLRGRLEDEQRRRVDDFDLLEFLDREARPPSWKPLEYNDDFFIRRYLDGEYRTISQLSGLLDWEIVIQDLPTDCDGRIVYLVAETVEELERAETYARRNLTHERLVVVIPREPLPLADAALEVDCLTRMQFDAGLVEADPLALSEIQQMADDARDHLQRLVDRLVTPGPAGPRWFYRGEELDIADARSLRRALSNVMHQVFSETPRINNEMVVRKKPSPIVVNSRKKLLLGILERHGQERLGLEGDFPDMSMFRTVLLHTGLYREDGRGRWGYAAPRAVEDPGLRAVWARFQRFVTEPSDHPKDFRPFFDELTLPPYGLRAGLVPIFLAASLKAFPSAVSLTCDGEYVVDVLPSEIENLCRHPEQYRLIVLDLDDSRAEYLRALHRRFSSVDTYQVGENDLIRLCFDAIEAWKAQLPPAALTTRSLSKRTEAFRTAITRSYDPVKLLFHRLPHAVGCEYQDADRFFAAIDHCIDELTSVTTTYSERAGATLRRAISLHRPDASLRDVGLHWAECFSDGFVEELKDGVAKGFLTRLRTEYKSDELLLNSLGSLLVGKALARWDDSTVAHFDREVQNVVHSIEDAALTQENSLSRDDEAVHGLIELVRGRIEELYERLERLVGVDDAARVVDIIRNRERTNDGDHTGSSEVRRR